MLDEPYNWANDDNWANDGATSGHVTIITHEPRVASGRPVSANSWGTGRDLDPFLNGTSREEMPDPHVEDVNTESEPHTNNSPTFSEEGNPREGGESVQDHDPQDPQENSEKRTLKGHFSAAREKIGSVRRKREPESSDEEEEMPGESGEKDQETRTIRSKIADARKEIDPRNLTSRRWSFLWATAAAWLVGPRFLIAVWDRAVRVFGQSQMMSGPQPMGFGLLHGPGRWFRDQVALHWENGSMGHLVLCAAFGIIHLVLIAAANTWGHYARWLLGTAILGPCVYMIGVSYAGWVLTWTDFYLVALFSSAWYCAVRLKDTKERGFVRFVLMVPLASVVSGLLLYSPGAVW